jgi:hypothetical protein
MKKNQTQFSILGILTSIILFSFSIKTDNSDYEKEIKAWHKNRVEGLKKENGWLNLAGLFWLDEGRNSFGGNIENKIIFPKDRSKAFLGDIILSKGEVFVEASKLKNGIYSYSLIVDGKECLTKKMILSR